MFCNRCGTEIAAGARFCAACGAPAQIGAPVGGTAQAGAASSVPTAPASCLVYLFGDTLVPRDTALTAGEKLPCSDVKVQKKPLTELMLETAFAGLAKDGRITFTLGQKGSFVFKHSALFVTVARRDPVSPGGLEALILGAIAGKQQADSVEEIVYRLIGNTSMDPWGDVVTAAKRALVPLGCFAEEKRPALKVLTVTTLSPICEAIASLRPQLASAEALLKNWQAANPAMQKVLHDDVARGIKSRYEAPDTDTDFPSSD